MRGQDDIHQAQAEHVNRALLPYDRSLLPYDRSLLLYDRSLLEPAEHIHQAQVEDGVGLVCYMIW